MELIKYDAACRALAEARSIDEVREFQNRAEAARAYARQSKNKQLELDALEIRVRAERRLGEIIIELRAQKLLRVQGVRDYTPRGKESPVRLSDIGIDGEESGIAQRLACLPHGRFEEEMEDWRRATEFSKRIEVPLQHIRVPTIKADRQRADARKGRRKIQDGDLLARFTSVDGRRVADWRVGELSRLEVLFARLSRCAATLREEMPVANPDPLATVESVYPREELAKLLCPLWDEPLPQGDRGQMANIISAARARRTRICETCTRQFEMTRNSAGRFCSRRCAVASRNS